MNRFWMAAVAASWMGMTAAGAAHVPGHLAAEGAKQDVAAALSDGEVRKVDKGAGKVTLKHGPLENLNMPAMTMVFRIHDPAWLDSLKEGDRIRFRAEKKGGAYVVTEVMR